MLHAGKTLICFTEIADVGYSLRRSLLNTSLANDIYLFYPETDCHFIKNLSELKLCLPPVCILLFLSDTLKLQEYLWGKVRIEAKSLCPIVVLSFEGKDEFLEKPFNLVFKDRPYQYCYVDIPFKLETFVEVISGLRSIHDDTVRISDIKKYSNPQGLFSQYIHHTKDALNDPKLENNSKLNKCGYFFQNIKGLLPFLKITKNDRRQLEFYIDDYLKQPKMDDANKLVKFFESYYK